MVFLTQFFKTRLAKILFLFLFVCLSCGAMEQLAVADNSDDQSKTRVPLSYFARYVRSEDPAAPSTDSTDVAYPEPAGPLSLSDALQEDARTSRTDIFGGLVAPIVSRALIADVNCPTVSVDTLCQLLEDTKERVSALVSFESRLCEFPRLQEVRFDWGYEASDPVKSGGYGFWLSQEALRCNLSRAYTHDGELYRVLKRTLGDWMKGNQREQLSPDDYRRVLAQQKEIMTKLESHLNAIWKQYAGPFETLEQARPLTKILSALDRPIRDATQELVLQ